MRRMLIIVGTLLVAILLVLGACAPASVPAPPLTPAPEETSSPPPAPEPIPTPAPTSPTVRSPVPETNLEIAELNFVRDHGGCYLGFVKNIGDSAVEGVRVTLTLYDEAGVILAEEQAPVSASLRPGERHPFIMGRKLKPLESYGRYEIHVEALPYHEEGMMPGLCSELKVISERWWEQEERPFGVIRGIRGTLQNTSQKTAEWIHICAAGYDKEGKLAAVGDGFPAARTIGSGVSVAFELVFLPYGTPNLTDYEFFISCRLED